MLARFIQPEEFLILESLLCARTWGCVSRAVCPRTDSPLDGEGEDQNLVSFILTLSCFMQGHW